MKAAKQRDFRRIPVCFWFSFGNNTFRVTLLPGGARRFYEHHRTDEGWQSESSLIRLIGRRLILDWCTDGRDCDGRLTCDGKMVCPVHHRQQRRAGKRGSEKAPRHRFPAWVSVSEKRRDESAIAMGY